MESNGGFGANSGPSWGDRCRRAFRPIEASKDAVCFVRNTQLIAVIRRRLGERAEIDPLLLFSAVRWWLLMATSLWSII